MGEQNARSCGRGSRCSRSTVVLPGRVEPGEQDRRFPPCGGGDRSVYSMGSSESVSGERHRQRPALAGSTATPCRAAGRFTRFMAGVYAGSHPPVMIAVKPCRPARPQSSRGPRFPNCPGPSTSSGACRTGHAKPVTCQNARCVLGPRFTPMARSAAAVRGHLAFRQTFDPGGRRRPARPWHSGPGGKDGFVAGPRPLAVSGPAAAGGRKGRPLGGGLIWKCSGSCRAARD